MSYLNIKMGALALVFLSQAAGCDSDHNTACTLIGCGIDGVVVRLAGENGAPVPAGAYRVTAIGGEDTQICDIVIPGDGAGPVCSLYLPEGSVENPGVSWLGFAPAKVTITVTRGGAVVGELQDFEPVYTSTRPNGDKCEPVCRLGPALVEVTS